MERGPGAGYMSAKAEALALKPTLRCTAVFYGNERLGYVVADPKDANRQYGRGPNSRDAWNEALDCLRTGRRPSLEKTW
jgi:hypothetical protein